MRALTVDYRIKHVFVVDDDIDIWSDRECYSPWPPERCGIATR